MPSDVLNGLTSAEINLHIRKALSGFSGAVVLEYLRIQCFMHPDPKHRPGQLKSPEQIVSRYSRMTLFQGLEHILQSTPKQEQSK